MSAVAATARAGQSTTRPWLTSYPPGVPADLDATKVGTLVDLFRESVREYAPRPAFESFDKAITYKELSAGADAFAAYLQARGFVKGDRVAIMMPNVLAYPVALFGALVGGYVVVNVNPLYTPRELAHQLNDSGARVLVVLENFAHAVEQAWSDLKLDQVLVATPGDLMGLKGTIVNLVSRYVKKAVPRWSIPGAVGFAKALAEGGGKTLKPVTVTGDDLAFLQYTGGTTGVSKGAMLSHRNVAANVEQSRMWLGNAVDDSEPAVMVTALPLYHIFALTACCMFTLRVGGCALLIANPRDIDGFVKTLASHRFTRMSGVNTLYNALIHHPDINKVDFSKMTFAVAGGMATQVAVAKAWKKLTGRPLIEGYGLSETSPTVSTNRPDLEDFSGTIGFPMPSTDVSIRLDDGSVAPFNTPGELCVKGPQVMRGYWNRPDETAKVTTPDGYFRTGDIAVMLPDGQLKIVDRKKDMIIVSGFNVFPNEVEDVLAAHPKVLEAAVIGLPDEHSGERVAAYVVKRDQSLTAEELRDYARTSLTGYKIPRDIVFRDQLPKTNVGKILRRALREEVTKA